MSNQLASKIDTQTVPVDTRKTPVHIQTVDLDAQAISLNTRTATLDAKTAHNRLRQALTILHQAECSAVIIFAEILHRRLFRQLGFSSIHIYASEALGFSRTKTYEFIRLAESLKKLPQLRTGVESGEMPWTKACSIAKVATPETENRWLEIARSSSRRELEQQVIRSKALRKAKKRNRGQGELLTDHASAIPAPGQGELLTENGAAKPAPPEAAPVQSVSLRLDPLKRARFDAMVEKLMKRHHCGKSEVVLMALEAFLGSGQKSSRLDSAAPYQVIVYQCETCGVGAVGPERRLLSAAEKAQIECDSKILEPGKRNRSSIPPSRRRAVLLRDGHRCRVQGCGSTHFLEVHHMKNRQDGGSNDEDNLVVLCSKCHGHLHQRGGVLPFSRSPVDPMT